MMIENEMIAQNQL